MEIDWDEWKRLENLRVHKYDFQDAWKIFNGLEFTFEDKARFCVSYPFAKPPKEKPVNTPTSYVSETDWEALDAMDDADIVLDDECPEMQASDFERGTLRFNGREPTREEIKEGMRLILNYLYRQEAAKGNR